jgi:hypothetical protein
MHTESVKQGKAVFCLVKSSWRPASLFCQKEEGNPVPSQPRAVDQKTTAGQEMPYGI